MPVWMLPFFIFFARIGDVTLGTVRTICVLRGRRWTAMGLGFFEILIWITAVSSVFAHLDQWVNAVAYAAGFAAGNGVGMWVEGKLAFGIQMLSFTSQGKAQAVAERLRFAGLRVTALSGDGNVGSVALCATIVPRKRAEQVIRMARSVDPDVLVTVADTRETTALTGPSLREGQGEGI